MSLGALGGVSANEILEVPETLSAEVRAQAMPEVNSSELGTILHRYYHEGLGGPEAWGRLKSVRLTGTLRRGDQAYMVEELFKKPDQWKQEMRGGTVHKLRGFDGEIAWRQPDLGKPAKVLKGAWAECYALDTHLGSQLLYPYAAGKQIEYLGSVPLEGTIGHRIRVRFEGRPIVFEYTIEVPGYYERERVMYIEENGVRTRYSAEYDAYRLSEVGVPIARTRTYYKEGELMYSMRLDAVRTNSGLTSWMFAKPE